MDIAICVIKIYTPSGAFVVVMVYRSPTGDVTYFLSTLETALDQLYNNTANIILCGDFSINYLSDNKKKQKLNSLLTSYSLYSIVDFPTRTNNTTSIAIDNIFINKFKYENYEIYPLINGLSDHNAQILRLPNTSIPNYGNELHIYREINEFSLNEFQINLSHETRKNVFNNNDKDTNTTFNNFLDTFLKTFIASFPVKKAQLKRDNKNWLTTGIRTSCNNKRRLYLLYKDNKDLNLKKYYKEYCKLLKKVITLAKKLYYSAKLANSNNKLKTTWNTINQLQITKRNQITC